MQTACHGRPRRSALEMWNVQTHRDVFFYICSCAAKNSQKLNVFVLWGCFCFQFPLCSDLARKPVVVACRGQVSSSTTSFVSLWTKVWLEVTIWRIFFNKICVESAKLWQSWTHGKSPFIYKEFGLFMSNL